MYKRQSFDNALRNFLSRFWLPGEAQKIDRMMEKFAERFCALNPGVFANTDTAYVLAFSLIMLNTDAHSAQMKKKMTQQEFVNMNRGINDSGDLPTELLESLYQNITTNEIKIKDETMMPTRVSRASDLSVASWSLVSVRLWLESATRESTSHMEVKMPRPSRSQS